MDTIGQRCGRWSAEGDGGAKPSDRVAYLDRPARIAVIGMRGVPNVIGGVERHCELLYPALAAAMPDLDVQLIVRRAYVAKRRFGFAGAEVRALWAPRSAALETVVHTLFAILYAAMRIRPDIVHLHGIGPGFFSPLARALGMRVVVTHHAADFQRPKWGVPGRLFLRAGEWLSARFADRIICVSATLRDEFLARNPRAVGRTTVVRHGTWMEPVTPTTVERLLAPLGLRRGGYLLAVGRFDETKRFEDLIAAHATLGPGALPLVIVGSPTTDRRYAEMLQAVAGDGVRFVGFWAGATLSALYEGAALMLHASAMEGFGLVILEALSMGTPVAISDIPVHREFGLFADAYFPVGDVDAIACAMAKASSRKRSSEALAIADHHSFERSVTAHARLFRQLLPDLPRPG